MLRARALIERRYASPLDLEQLAGAASLSRYHFIRRFKRAFRETPHRYLTRRRIERAKQLLRTTDLTVTAICYDVGFQSPGSFSSLFRREVGVSPGRYRERARRRLFPVRVVPVRAPTCFLWRLTPGRTG